MIRRFGISLTYFRLAIDIGTIISQEHVFIVIQQGVHQRSEKSRNLGRKEAGVDLVESLPQFRIGIIIISRPVAMCLQFADLLGREAEAEEILGPTSSRISIFAPSSVPPSARHSWRTSCCRCRRLLPAVEIARKARRRDKLCAVLTLKLGRKTTEAALDQRILIDDLTDGRDQFDDQLGHIIAGRGFASENARAWRRRQVGIFPQAIIERNDVKHVQVLTLVFVETFDLDVKEGVGVQHNASAPANQVCQNTLIPPLDSAPLFLERGVVRQWFELAQLIEVVDPTGPDFIRDQISEARIAERDETPRGDTIRDVGELFRREIMEVAQDARLQKLAVQFCDAIDRVAAHAGQMSHADVAHTVFLDQRHAPDSIVVAGIPEADRVQKPPINLVDDFKMAWQQAAEERDRPALKGLRHEGVVGIGKSPERRAPRLDPNPADARPPGGASVRRWRSRDACH